MLIKKKTLVCLSVAFLLSGCANRTENPYLYDITSYPDRVKVSKENKDQVVKVSYLASALMESDNRAEINNIVAKSELYREWSAAQVSTMAQMTTDLAVGQFSSSAGAQVGASVFAAGLVLGEMFDGSSDVATSAWLPQVYKGTEIRDAGQAEKAMIDFTMQQIQHVADVMGWKATCVNGCDSRIIQVHFTNSDNKPLHDDYVYKPSDFALQIGFNRLVEVKETDPVNALLGENIGWKTNGSNSYYVQVFSELEHESDGSVKRVYNKKDDEWYMRVRREISRTHLGRDIMRTFHSTPYTLFGNSDQYPKVIYYDDVIYSFSSNSNTYLASEHLKLRYLLDGKAPVVTPPEQITPVINWQ